MEMHVSLCECGNVQNMNGDVHDMKNTIARLCSRFS